MRIRQKQGVKGSLKWTQRLINEYPQLLDDAFRDAGILPLGESVSWDSPRRDDDWAEYRDGSFLDAIGHGNLKAALRALWPSKGPQWDALGRSGETVYLVEAKAHPDEMASHCSAKAKKSLEMISASLNDAKAGYGATGSTDWLRGHYQFANRLAHLRFLRQHGVDARLAFIYFVGDSEMTEVATEGEWVDVIHKAQAHLGVDAERLGPDVVDLFIDVQSLHAFTTP
jgi:hypothetical protein